jgi:hypothetical protein
MISLRHVFVVALSVSVSSLALIGSARAITMKECSAKYRQAEESHNLNGRSWNAFRKEECPSDAGKQESSEAVAPAQDVPQAAPVKVAGDNDNAKSPAVTSTVTKSASANADPSTKDKAIAKAPPPVPTGPIVYPSAISSKYATETPGKQREKTCLDQYNANKATNSNGGLKWIQAGGGYYSLCNKKLKG